MTRSEYKKLKSGDFVVIARGNFKGEDGLVMSTDYISNENLFANGVHILTQRSAPHTVKYSYQSVNIIYPI